MRKPYEDAVVLVTGASTGLGRAIAVGAAEQGAKVVVVNFASSLAEAEETARLVKAAGADVVLARGDVGDDGACRAVAAAAEPYGRIDALFNNAGISRMADHTDLDALSDRDFLDIYRVNVVGPYQMVRACRPLLEAAGVGSVVNTSSIAGVTGGGSSIAYSAAKGALNTMTLSLAKSLAPKIRVNAICPGFIDSPWFDKIGKPGAREKLRGHMAQTMPLQVASTPEDVAGSALFFGSRASGHVTGETLLVDAGMHLGAVAPARSR
jgi:NAD(P)-dependent dehydrogenase (short-subunit alcohol dehydrogenase family)